MQCHHEILEVGPRSIILRLHCRKTEICHIMKLIMYLLLCLWTLVCSCDFLHYYFFLPKRTQQNSNSFILQCTLMNQVMQKGTFWSGKINELLSSLPCWHPVAVLEIHFEIGQKFFVSEKKKKAEIWYHFIYNFMNINHQHIKTHSEKLDSLCSLLKIKKCIF